MAEHIPAGTQWYALPSPFPMHRGGAMHGARVAFETWGELAADGGNAILLLPGMSPDAHAASQAADPTPGWWEWMIGPGKPIDTRRWFVICVNHLGSCKGSTGPASIDPATGDRYRLDFPDLSVEDMADAAAALVRGLGVGRLACVVGNSLGGMAALALLQRHPGIAGSTINICGAPRALPFSIAIRSLQREAIRLDGRWEEGAYDDGDGDGFPVDGMRMARKLGVVTYRSALEWAGRFGRVRLDPGIVGAGDGPFAMEFEVERYLEAHAQRFVRRFDPNAYLYMSRAMDWFDLADAGDRPFDAAVAGGLRRALVIGVGSDILFPVEQQVEIGALLEAAGCHVRARTMASREGHDAFLVDRDRFGPAVADFLAGIPRPAAAAPGNHDASVA